MKLYIGFLTAFFLIQLTVLNATVNTAIISSKDDKLSDLLTAELSKNPDIQLLERKDLKNIFDENELLMGFLTPEQLSRTDGLLRADLFLYIEYDPDSEQPSGLYIFDADTGISYQNSALPYDEDNLEKTLRFIEKALKNAIIKRKKSKQGTLEYISVLSVENVNLPPDADLKCKAIEIYLKRKISGNDSAVLLERTHLELLNKERELPSKDKGRKLLIADKIIKLKIYKSDSPPKISGQTLNAGKEAIKCKLFINDEKTLDLYGELSNPDEFTDRLVKAIVKNKTVKKKITVNPQREAERYYREFKIASSRNDTYRGFEKISAAYALTPDNQKIMLAYIAALNDYGAKQFADKRINNDQLLDTIESIVNIINKLKSKQPLLASSIPFRLLLHFIPVTDKGFKYYKFTNAQTHRLKKIYGKLINALRIANLGPYKNPMGFHEFTCYTTEVGNYINTDYMFSPQQWTDDMLPVFEKWCDESSEFYLNKENNTPFGFDEYPFQAVDNFIEYNFNFVSKNQDIFLNLAARLRDKSFVPIKLYGTYLLFMIEFANKLTEARYDKLSKKFIGFKKKIVKELYPKFRKQFAEEALKLSKEASDVDKKAFMYYLSKNTDKAFIYSGYENIPDKDKFLQDMITQALKNTDEKKVEKTESEILLENFIAMEMRKAVSDYNDPEIIKNIPLKNARVLINYTYKNSTANAIGLLSYHISDDKSFGYFLLLGEENCDDERFRNPHLAYLVKIDFSNLKETIVAQFDSEYNYELIIENQSAQSEDDPYCLSSNNFQDFHGKIYENFYISPSCAGIIVVPLNGDKPFKIDKKNGLYSNNIRAVCVKNGVIYALEYDKNRRFLISAEIKENTKVKLLYTVEEDTRSHSPSFQPKELYYSAQIFKSNNANKIIVFTGKELAEFDIENNTWKKLRTPPEVRLVKKYDKNTIMLGCVKSVYLYNMLENELEMILAPNKKTMAKEKAKLFYKIKHYEHSGPYALSKKYLWLATPFWCQSLETGQLKKIPSTNFLGDTLIHIITILEVVDNGNKLLINFPPGLYICDIR